MPCSQVHTWNDKYVASGAVPDDVDAGAPASRQACTMSTSTPNAETPGVPGAPGVPGTTAFVSSVYNKLSRVLFHVPVKDLNSVKAYRREIMEVLPTRPDWHRYMIVIAAAQGYSVTEIPVPLYPRHAGKSKFGIGRIPVGVLDMLSVWFELRFAQKPLLLFGMLGAALFAVLAIFDVLGAVVIWTVLKNKSADDLKSYVSKYNE